MERNRLQGSVVPFARRWHVIQEIDLVRLVGEHRRRAALCDRLEAVADRLPDRPAPDEAAAIERALAAVVERDERDEIALLRAMLLHGPVQPLARSLIDHIRRRHASDAAAAQELTAALQPTAARDPVPSAETLGHMLRGFFTGCRRAIDFEQLTILTLAGHRLTPDARALLVEALSANLSD